MKPPQDFIKLNCDGSCYGNPGPTSIGGIFRNEQCGWVTGYAFDMGIAYSLDAKICSIRLGLKIAWDIGFRHLWVESDCEVAVNLILLGDHSFHSSGHIILDCREYLLRNWNCRISHVHREGNKCADFLANWGHDYCGLTLLTSPPTGLGSLILDDIVGLPVARL
ncbi:hypothetical protein L1049_014871 [Liquidambar formosana]|uniref:RNase H type-1 domain-containing protein n=1 Tax=Liquidambar formosana TaxID=63359 RepID=A0AAP0S3E6_LIQFO